MTELHEDLLVDSSNLSKECFQILEELHSFAYPRTDVFLIEDYGKFLQNRNSAVLQDLLRKLANKTHGLKGISGFVYPKLKDTCHQSESLIKPLAGLEIVFSQAVNQLLREFFLWVTEYLDTSPAQHLRMEAEDWGGRFVREETAGRRFVANNESLIKHLIESRATDNGEIRNRPPSTTISVSQEGYERLLLLASQLHQIAVTPGTNAPARSEALLSEFLQIHQRNKLNALDLSRYERVVPKLAAQYGLKVLFVPARVEIRGEDKFLSALHEITNHIVKNAITHAIESPEERKAAGKPPTGSIEFSGHEDAMSYYITLSDDGRGINTKVVGERAVTMGLVRADELARMNESQILRLVFAQGLSTAKALDDNAGRGVGLNAVQDMLQSFMGSVDLETKRGLGTRWTFRFQKIHVALPCMVVEVHGHRLAIPEYSVSTLAQHAWNTQNGYFKRDGSLIGLVDPVRLLHIQPTSEQGNFVVVLNTGRGQFGFPAMTLLGRRVLFVQPAPTVINESGVFAGMSLIDGQPILVMDVNKVFEKYKQMLDLTPAPATESNSST